MKIELTKEEISILNDGLLQACMEIGKNKNNKFIDKQQLAKYESQVMGLLHKLNESEA